MRRAIAVVAAVLLAAVGTFLLVNYVRGAEERVLEGEELVNVLVVEEPIRRGAPAESLIDKITEVAVPVKVRAAGALSNLADIAGLVAAVDLVPGEQLLADRFLDPATLITTARMDVPPEYLQVTVSLRPERAIGGELIAGDRVAVIASFEPFEYTYVHPEELEEVLSVFDQDDVIYSDDGVFIVRRTLPADALVEGEEEETIALEAAPFETPFSTRIIFHKALVTNVQAEELPPEESETDGSAAVELAPTGNLLITLAVPPDAVEEIVFTAEFGFLWLAAEDEEAAEPDTEITTRGNIYQ